MFAWVLPLDQLKEKFPLPLEILFIFIVPSVPPTQFGFVELNPSIVKVEQSTKDSDNVFGPANKPVYRWKLSTLYVSQVAVVSSKLAGLTNLT